MRLMKNMKLHASALDYLRGVRLMNGKIEDRDMNAIPLPADAPKRVEIRIKPGAYAKMITLLKSFSTEIGWHGICKRDAEQSNVFTIEDIFVYPQIVTGSNINTDESAQDEWNRSFSNEDFNNLRFHGHSHVNMGVFSSGTDDDLQRDIINMLTGDSFYLFFIMNKRLDLFIRLYDAKYSVMYETADCDVVIADDGLDLVAFLEDSKKMVKERKVTVTPTYSGGYSGGAHNTNHFRGSSAANYPSHQQGTFSDPTGAKREEKGNKGKSQETKKNQARTKWANDGYSDETYPYGWYDENGAWHELRGGV